MGGFRVFYRQGSFALTDLCGSWEEAVAHARCVRRRRGVWLVRIEDADGRRVHGSEDFDLWEAAATIGNEADDAAENPPACDAAPTPGLAAPVYIGDSRRSEARHRLAHACRRSGTRN